MLRSANQFFSRRSTGAVVTTGLLLVVLMGLIDYFSGPEISFSIFYLVPIYLVSWYAGRWPGVTASVACTLAWYLADLFDGHVYSTPLIHFWNASARLGFFLVSAFLISELRRRLIFEAELAVTDPLTKIANRRGVYQAVEVELIRQRRMGRPITAAYLDVDGFKAVNDRLGHHVGDELLRIVAETIRSQIRQLDTAGRLGGDEFLLLLPETGHEAASELLSRLKSALTRQTQLRDWPVSFSIGVATFLEPPESVDELLRQTDRLLYAAKSDGKDTIRSAIIGADRSSPASRPSGAVSAIP
jgi:diguanylate cyclase (GGDEF)-like protein